MLNCHGRLQLNGAKGSGIMGVAVREARSFVRLLVVVISTVAVSISFKPFANEAFRINI
jgi:hypothetical protein